MGASQTKDLLISLYSSLGPDDQEAFREAFNILNDVGEAPQLRIITADPFKAFCATLPPELMSSLFDLMREHSTHKGTRAGVDEFGFASTVAILVRGLPLEKASLLAEWILRFSHKWPLPQHDNANLSTQTFSRDEFLLFVQGIATAALRTHQLLKNHPGTSSNTDSSSQTPVTAIFSNIFASSSFSTYIASQGFAPEAKNKPIEIPQLLTFSHLSAWISRASLFIKLLDTFALFTFRHRDELIHDTFYQQYPSAKRPEKGEISEKRKAEGRESGLRLPRMKGPSSSLLSHESIWLLNMNVPAPCRHSWRALFNDRINGKSWTLFTKTIISQGPTIIVIEDEQGNLFGGFSAQSWVKLPRWYGNADCFLFKLKPTIDVFLAGTLNDHYQYLNFGTETMPNGLGMGGQFSFFGMFIEEGLEHGHSKADPRSTTFNSTRLSANDQFKIARIEVWGLLEPAVDTTKDNGPSILDQFKEDQVLLEWAGKQMYSKDHRDGKNNEPEED